MPSAIMPGFRYDNAPSAIEFLCQAFGFTRHAVYTDPNDASVVYHAELTLGGSMIMLGSATPEHANDGLGMRTPHEAGGVTMMVYVVVADPDVHHGHAAAHGAVVVRAPADNQGYPGRSYTARDCEGHVWSFGSYDPMAPGYLAKKG